MRILRSLVVGSVFGLSVLAIGFVSADRLAHLPTAPALQSVQVAAPGEPRDTGSIPTLVMPEEAQTAGPGPLRPTGARPSTAKTAGARPSVTKTASAKPVPAKAKGMDGFDTERLNALLRGDPITPPRR